ncbi:hypothetical protein [Sphingobacterium sp. MYb382]|uniref:hypothetical protein n=1 Tax=Sphingobacterium sp. MYb382 TaxID=2745278 RepID=UPI00309B7B2F
MLRHVMLSLSKHQEDNLEGLLLDKGLMQILALQTLSSSILVSNEDDTFGEKIALTMELCRLFLSKIILRLVMLSLSKHQEDNLEGLLTYKGLMQILALQTLSSSILVANEDDTFGKKIALTM